MSGDGRFPPAVLSRIADGIEAINKNLIDLRELQRLSWDEYRDDDHRLHRAAVERTFVQLTAATIDIANSILSAERRSVPDHRKASIVALRELDVIDEDLESRLREAVGFRDVLAHSYGPIVNDRIVYEALQDDLERYREFVDAVDEYLPCSEE